MKRLEHIFGKHLKLALIQHIGLHRRNNASRLGWHSHDGFEVLFLLEGATVYEFNSADSVELHGGQFLVVPPHRVHRGKQDMRSPSRFCGLVLTPQLERARKNTTFTHDDLTRLNRSLNQAAMTVHPLNATLRDILRRINGEVEAYWDRPEDAVGHATLRTLVCAALLEVVRQVHLPAREPDYIATGAMAHLDQHYLKSVSIEELSRFLGYSRTRTYELFKSQTGLTPKDYLQRLRVRKAEELLRRTRRSVTEIAHDVGFNSSQYFSTVFRRYTGQTPAAFRQNSKKGE